MPKQQSHTNEEEILKILKDDIYRYCPVVIGSYGEVAEEILEKIRPYIKKDGERQRLERVISYRLLSILSEVLIVFAVTGSWEFSLIISPLCLIVHTSLHWLVDKIIR